MKVGEIENWEKERDGEEEKETGEALKTKLLMDTAQTQIATCL